METKRTSNLTPYGVNGWRWTVIVNDSTRVYVRKYHTNGDGNGLWVWSTKLQADKQIEGTAEFSLSSNRDKALRQIRKYNKQANLY